MPSHKTLALLALAASTASPALSAPVPYASCISTLETALADAGVTFLGRARRRLAPVQPFPALGILSRRLHPVLASALCPLFCRMSLVVTARAVRWLATCWCAVSLMVSPTARRQRMFLMAPSRAFPLTLTLDRRPRPELLLIRPLPPPEVSMRAPPTTSPALLLEAFSQMVSNPTRSLGPLSVTASPALSLEAFSQTVSNPTQSQGPLGVTASPALSLEAFSQMVSNPTRSLGPLSKGIKP
ncbi:hypothetical protein H4582DRAFT_955228 [Lactarius indigo]|nr:hypothetical protein H4582DRAFT_955228 [Lactarius indigo]